MADIGTATVRVTPNMQGIQGKIAAGFKGSAGPATAALGDEVEKNSGPFQNALGKLGGLAKTTGLAIGAGMLAGAAGLAALSKQALMSGAELEQNLGGAEAVFGEFHKKLDEYRSNLHRLYYRETVDSMVREYRTKLLDEIFGEELLTEDENEHCEDDVYYKIEEVSEL